MRDFAIRTLLAISILALLLAGCKTVAPEEKVCLPVKAPSADDIGLVEEGSEVDIGEDVVVDISGGDTAPEDKSTPVKKPGELILIEDNIPTVKAVEGELVKFELKAVDPDGDRLDYEYSAPLDAGGRWQTKVGDAGTYFSTIKASDGTAETSQQVRIIVLPKNKAPELMLAEEIEVDEGSTIILKPYATDPENDKITLAFEGWMASDTYATNFNDEGIHFVTVTATDGQDSTSATIKITVNNVNRPPVLGELVDINGIEGDTITLEPVAVDMDKDPVTYEFSAPFGSNGVWETGYDDAGSYAVVVTASDGTASDTKAFKVTILNKNRPPVIAGVEDITVKEGETVSFSPAVSDPDGDTVEVTYKGWMTSSSYTTTYDDQGEHEVYVVATDGTDATVVQRFVRVVNVNRPPQFQLG